MVDATYTGMLESGEAGFSPMPQPSFIARLLRALGEGAREFVRNPLRYLRLAFLPPDIWEWLPLRVISAISWGLRNPISLLSESVRRERIPVGFIYEGALGSASFVTNAFSPSISRVRARDRFIPVLVASGALHGALIIVLVYLTIANMLSPYAHVRIVAMKYRPFDSGQLAELYKRSKIVQPTGKVLTLEELAKRQEEIARKRAEDAAKAAEEKAKAEEAAKAAEEKAKAEEAAKKSNGSIADIAINETAIKDMVTKMYDRYKKGELDVDAYTVLVAFRIDCDGTMPRSSIKVLRSSPPNAKKEELALQILWLIGESHAMGPLCQFSSNTIGFEMNDEMTRLSITGFGPTAEWTNQKATELRVLFAGLAYLRRGTDPGELAKLVKISTTNKRLDLDLTLSKARASEMMRNKFSGSSQ